jgi:hypothetical protein
LVFWFWSCLLNLSQIAPEGSSVINFSLKKRDSKFGVNCCQNSTITKNNIV